MDEKNDNDDLLLPGFRFHPTDEELVEFYLRRKLQQQSLPFEPIKQVDIYKYEPWDLPKLTGIGEKEWYFFCPRDRKYKNSARPNRVTGSGFWKATGTDRPIYSSGGNKCIGFKKSLVFYRGRAAKCMKTDWMMHEFRLPPASNTAKSVLDKNFPASDSLALCRIFRKTVSMANRALSCQNDIPFNSNGFSSTSENEFRQENMSAPNLSSYKTIIDRTSKPSAFTSSGGESLLGSYHLLDPGEVSGTTNVSPACKTSGMVVPETCGLVGFEGPQQFFNGFPANSRSQVMHEIVDIEAEEEGLEKNPWEFPFSLPSDESGSWNPSNLPWESSHGPW